MLKKHRNGMYIEMVQNTKTDAAGKIACIYSQIVRWMRN